MPQPRGAGRYVSYSNAGGQAVDPYTARPFPRRAAGGTGASDHAYHGFSAQSGTSRCRSQRRRPTPCGKPTPCKKLSCSLALTAERAQFWVGNVPGCDDAPPDYLDDDDATIRAGLASWLSEFEPAYATSFNWAKSPATGSAVPPVAEASGQKMPRRTRRPLDAALTRSTRPGGLQSCCAHVCARSTATERSAGTTRRYYYERDSPGPGPERHVVHVVLAPADSTGELARLRHGDVPQTSTPRRTWPRRGAARTRRPG